MSEVYTIKLFRNETVIWQFNLPDPAVAAGALAAGISIMDDMNADSQNAQHYSLDTDADVSEFLRVRDVLEADIRDHTCGHIGLGEYGLWMKGKERFLYNLYGFSDAQFIQGVISMCHAFGVDFRNYLYGFPFDIDNKQYALADYVMAPDQVAVTVPDLDDAEIEEADDPFFINPYSDSIDSGTDALA